MAGPVATVGQEPAQRRRQRDATSRLATLAGKLESLSPLGVLERGYSITQDKKTGRVVRDAAKLRTGQQIVTRLARGTATSTIDKITKPT